MIQLVAWCNQIELDQTYTDHCVDSWQNDLRDISVKLQMYKWIEDLRSLEYFPTVSWQWVCHDVPNYIENQHTCIKKAVKLVFTIYWLLSSYVEKWINLFCAKDQQDEQSIFLFPGLSS